LISIATKGINKMGSEFEFTFANLEKHLIVALENGYQFMTCYEYAQKKLFDTIPDKLIVLRIDIDFSCIKANRLLDILDKLLIKASFFVRLHAPEYNPFSFENYRILKGIRDAGHEIGYHSEIVDQSVIWHEDAGECLLRDLKVLNLMLEISIKGVASHGGMTGLNNLDFWKNKTAKEFGLVYEAYENSATFNLFEESFYISDSEWTQWKCYDHGKLVVGDKRSPSQHILNKHKLIYLLIHPDTYFDRHFYE
jgi:hypothetical protein